MLLDRRTFVASFLAYPIARTSLQSRLDAIMSQRPGTALVLDVPSGRVLAQHRLDVAARRLVSPGSVIKPFVMSALIDSNLVESSTMRKCSRTLRIDGRNLDCAHLDSGEALDPIHALGYSCNSYFAQLSPRLDPRILVQSLTAFGLTSSTAFAQREVTGSVALPNNASQLQLLALGEAGVKVTALEIGAAYRRLALVKRAAGDRSRRLALVFDGLAAAAEYGTARLAQPYSMAIGGKTGTASEGPGRRTHAWFAGYAPASRPETVVIIFLETGSGGRDAAPVAKEIFEAL